MLRTISVSILEKALLPCLCFAIVQPLLAEVREAEVCVFGATSGGIAAAIQAARMGKTVVLAEPGKYLGGMTTGGLGATDIGNKAAIGGLAREFYVRIARHYAQDAAWKLERRQDYFAKREGYQMKASGPAVTNQVARPCGPLSRTWRRRFTKR